MMGMRLLLLAVLAVSSGCITVHTIDLGASRTSLGESCEVPMNRGGQVPNEGWSEIGRVQIDGANDWSDEHFAAEIRSAACEMGAQYVVVNGDPNFMEGVFLQQTGQPTGQAR